MARILYLHRDPPWAGFIADDCRILRSKHEVIDRQFEYGVLSLAKTVSLARTCDLVYFWWGDLAGCTGAVAARVFSRPSIMITGGYDVANVPDIGYGLRLHPIRKHFVPASLRLAQRVIANSDIMRRVVIDDYGISAHKVVAIHHGIDPSTIPFVPDQRQRMALTCAQVNASNISRKGVGTFVRAAALIPDCRFVVVGKIFKDEEAEALMASAPANVEFKGFVERTELIEYMQRATVVAQLSAHEGFGVALAEAMLAGATPVVTRRGALPEVVGDVGHYVPFGDVPQSADAIRRALEDNDPVKCRARIESHFPLALREQRILKLVEEVLESGR